MTGKRPAVSGVLETCLHVEDLELSARFYEELFGFQRMFSDQRACAFDVAGKDVLLLFKRGGSTRPVHVDGGVIPPHDGSGMLHFAFSIAADDLDAWEQRLKEHGTPIESRVDWESGGHSLYFRDPDRHLVELATPGIWPMY